MLESPATDPGRSAEETIRAEIIAALNAAFRGFSFPGGRWSTGYGAEMAADALLSGPLAPILQEAAQLRARLHEAEKAGERRGEETMCEAAAMVCDALAECADAALTDADPEQAERWQAAKHCAEELATAIRSLATPAPEANQEAGDA